jgi:hypothetical protein
LSPTVTCACPFGVSTIDFTEPTLAPAISTSSPVTSPPASWKLAFNVYAELFVNSTSTISTIAAASAAIAATRDASAARGGRRSRCTGDC